MVIAGLTPEMQFANGRRSVAGLAQRVVPTRHAAVIGVGVVPKTDLMHIAAGGKGGAGRHANGAAGIGLAETGAPTGQTVQVRGLDERMAGTAQELGVVLVGHQHQDIERFFHTEQSS